MEKDKSLSLKSLAIGSLPHEDVKKAMTLVEENFSAIPFWPQLAKHNKNEDMIIQFLEQIPGLVVSENKIYLDNETETFYEQLESLFLDYEEIFGTNVGSNIDKYCISDNFSSTFGEFINIIKKYTPNFAKGQIVGPFTLSTTLVDKNGRLCFYDETLREVITKHLTMKALWQIKEIKKANSETTPIIFIDEPSISQLGTSAYLTISKNEVLSMLKEVSDKIKEADAMSAIHCCGKSDWTIPIESGVDIINFDGFLFAQNLSLFSKNIDEFIKTGGYIAWGMIPTLDKDALEKIDLSELENIFEKALKFLTDKGVDKNILLKQSLITPSCGAGSLSIELAEKAMNLTKDFSQKLNNIYKEIL